MVDGTEEQGHNGAESMRALDLVRNFVSGA